MFSPGKPLNPEVRDAAIDLLALATAGGPLPSVPQQQQGQQGAGAAHGEGHEGAHGAGRGLKRAWEGGPEGGEGAPGKWARGEGGGREGQAAAAGQGYEAGGAGAMTHAGAAAEGARLKATRSALRHVLTIGAKAGGKGIGAADAEGVRQVGAAGVGGGG